MPVGGQVESPTDVLPLAAQDADLDAAPTPHSLPRWSLTLELGDIVISLETPLVRPQRRARAWSGELSLAWQSHAPCLHLLRLGITDGGPPAGDVARQDQLPRLCD